ncbi:hypothetical protein F5B22DRAFT_468814 [Xylaria bambusicola]|uniref:uncharacterized protein n=1 Tax=Xylaria bambusicola TaxID=326684 RepID=UPI0020073355|nr:uncharacterized protein F5B22DRAFT_468814 [Xylaria bambusicola]KAI0522277.1 hypothetical protein F5B22DRAFT_468814 [Xylaria bambusicola]
MLRPSQHLCRQGIARPIGRSLLCQKTSSSCWRATIIPWGRLSGNFIAQTHGPRHFATSHSRLSAPSKPTSQEPIATAFPSTPTETHASDLLSPPNPQRPKRRRWIIAMTLIIVGGFIGTVAEWIILPPPIDSARERLLVEKIQKDGNELPIVKELSTDPAWTSWDAYSGVSAARSRITSGPMAGFAGLPFQRIFHNAATGEVVTVVYFGGGLAGFPGFVHGGALATLLDESLGRCAILHFPSRTGVTANLDITYRHPTKTKHFYIIRAKPVVNPDDDVVGRDGVRKGDRKLWVCGTLENEKGLTVAEANGLFVVPKGFKLQPLVKDF